MNDLIREAQAVLQASGGRMTRQRMQIIETLGDLGGHPNAEQVCLAVNRRHPEIHRATVYRTLAWLADERILNVRHLDGSRGDRCEHYDQALGAEHYHFVCTRCERVIEFSAPQVEEISAGFELRYGAHVERTSLMLYGTCAACYEDTHR